MLVTLLLSLLESTIILLCERQATICEVVSSKAHQLIGLTAQIWTNVAGCTTSLLKELIAGQLLGRDCTFIASQILIETRVRRDESSLELLYGIGDICLCYSIRIELLECRYIELILLELGNNLIERFACHLHWIQRRPCSLLGKRCGTSIPELHEIIYCVIYSWSIHSTQLTIDTLRVLLVIHTCCLQTVTRSTRHCIINRQTHIVIEFAAQFCLALINLQRLGYWSHWLTN